MHHEGKWFKGEHQAILDRPTFERVQTLLKSNRITRRIKHSESGALLRGKLFDDRDNAMSPSFTSKNGVRYRSYVSTALNGRKHKAGSVTRISAPKIERLVDDAVVRRLEEQGASTEQVWDRVERAVVTMKGIRVSWTSADGVAAEVVDIPRTAERPDGYNNSSLLSAREPDQKLLQALARAHAWLSDLANDRFASVEDLASCVAIHPKVMREAIKLAFLDPDIVTSILTGEAVFELADLRKVR